MKLSDAFKLAPSLPWEQTEVFNDDGDLLLLNIGNVKEDRRACSISSTPDEEGVIDHLVISDRDQATADLIVHCVNNFAQVVGALETIANMESYAGEVMQMVANKALAAAQTIPSGEKEGE